MPRLPLALALALALAMLGASAGAAPPPDEPDALPAVSAIAVQRYGAAWSLSWRQPIAVDTVILLDAQSRIIGLWGPVAAGQQLLAQQVQPHAPGDLVTILEIWRAEEAPPLDLAVGQVWDRDAPTLATQIVRYTTLRTGQLQFFPALTLDAS